MLHKFSYFSGRNSCSPGNSFFVQQFLYMNHALSATRSYVCAHKAQKAGVEELITVQKNEKAELENKNHGIGTAGAGVPTPSGSASLQRHSGTPLPSTLDISDISSLFRPDLTSWASLERWRGEDIFIRRHLFTALDKMRGDAYRAQLLAAQWRGMTREERSPYEAEARRRTQRALKSLRRNEASNSTRDQMHQSATQRGSVPIKMKTERSTVLLEEKQSHVPEKKWSEKTEGLGARSTSQLRPGRKGKKCRDSARSVKKTVSNLFAVTSSSVQSKGQDSINMMPPGSKLSRLHQKKFSIKISQFDASAMANSSTIRK